MRRFSRLAPYLLTGAPTQGQTTLSLFQLVTDDLPFTICHESWGLQTICVNVRAMTAPFVYLGLPLSEAGSGISVFFKLVAR